MKILVKVVAGALYQGGTGPAAQAGDQVKLFLDTEANTDFPEFILGVIQHPISTVDCGSSTSYRIEYDEADLEGAATLIHSDDVIDVQATSAADIINERIAQYPNLFIPPTTDPEIAGAVWNDGGSLAISSGPA
jgi:hypothetical protein